MCRRSGAPGDSMVVVGPCTMSDRSAQHRPAHAVSQKVDPVTGTLGERATVTAPSRGACPRHGVFAQPSGWVPSMSVNPCSRAS